MCLWPEGFQCLKSPVQLVAEFVQPLPTLSGLARIIRWTMFPYIWYTAGCLLTRRSTMPWEHERDRDPECGPPLLCDLTQPQLQKV
jgi:hypothetical protein